MTAALVIVALNGLVLAALGIACGILRYKKEQAQFQATAVADELRLRVEELERLEQVVQDKNQEIKRLSRKAAEHVLDGDNPGDDASDFLSDSLSEDEDRPSALPSVIVDLPGPRSEGTPGPDDGEI